MRAAIGRLVVALFWWATALYCLLGAIPFASEQFLKPGLSPTLALFAAWHRWIAAAALVAAAAALAPWLRAGDRGVRAFVAVWAVVAVGLFIAPPLSKIEPTLTALALAILALVPPVWISVMPLAPERSDTAVKTD